MGIFTEKNIMFSKDKLEKYADVMVWGLEIARKSGKLGKYENAVIKYHLPSQPLVEQIYKRLLERKLNVTLKPMATPELDRIFFDKADDKQLQYIAAGEKEYNEDLHGYIAVRAPESLTHLKNVDPKKFALRAVAAKPVRDIMDKREDNGKFSWTLCTYPTQELAKQAGISVKKYAQQIEKACFLNEKDPVKKWKEIYVQAQEIKKWLLSLKIEKLYMQSKSMDLEILLGEKRKFNGLSGHNIPSFEIFTSPDWRGTKGTYYSDLPSYMHGNLVKGILLEFKNGKAVKVKAKQGENFVKKMLSMDAGASQIGEFSLTDKRFSKIDCFMADTLFDENFGGKFGNSHLAVGNSYSDTFNGDTKKLTPQMKKTLGFNESALHWDLVNTEDKKVTALLKNGKKVTIYEKGMFKN